MITFSDFPQLHLSSRYFRIQIFHGLQYIGARAPLYWSPLTTALWNIILWLIENPFLSWINPIQMDWVLLNLICVIAKKYFRPTSLFCKTNIWWAPIYWSPGSIILEPRFQYIGAPSVQKHVFCFIFELRTQNSPSSFIPRILKIKLRGLQYIGAPSSSWLTEQGSCHKNMSSLQVKSPHPMLI